METLNKTMNDKYSKRMQHVPRSFIRDILKVAASPDVISFAGGLPNQKYFPVNEITESSVRVLRNNSASALQYNITQGLPELREIIATFYLDQGLHIPIENIMVTTGSQQALDLIGKVFINENDHVIIEEPSYLGAIQAFSMYHPNFIPIELQNDGINIRKFESALSTHTKLTYMVPNFQNPTGTTYSDIKRKDVASLAIRNDALIVEDDPYGKINFGDKKQNNIYKYAPDNTLLLGSFSKTIVPGFRLGWIIGNPEIINKLEVAKQASDLHTDVFAQQIVFDFLKHNDLNEHLVKINQAYKKQCEVMIGSIKKYMPSDVKCTKPYGGMFAWMTLPEKTSSLKLFDTAIKKGVAFVPGVPFFINKGDSNCLRLNFSCSEPEQIVEGMKRISEAFYEM